LFALLAISCNGCKKHSGLVPVHGKVSYRGESLKSARITFFSGKGQPLTTVVTDGEYDIELPPEDYTVVVNVGAQLPPGFKEGDPVPTPKLVLPDQYSTRARSTLKATVAASQTEPIDFALQ
jgi:hypothetical protein